MSVKSDFDHQTTYSDQETISLLQKEQEISSENQVYFCSFAYIIKILIIIIFNCIT